MTNGMCARPTGVTGHEESPGVHAEAQGQEASPLGCRDFTHMIRVAFVPPMERAGVGATSGLIVVGCGKFAAKITPSVLSVGKHDGVCFQM